MSRLTPNPSQRAVMDCRQRLCVVAGAGSGKTGTLVESITLRLEESIGRQPELNITEILALTFTDKAAAEMRLRLARAFEHRRLNSPDQRTAEFWRRQTARLDRADIGTIHGFALKLLRENPLELGLTDAPELDDGNRDLSLDVSEVIRDWLDEDCQELMDLLRIYRLTEIEQMLVKSAATMSSWGLKALSADLTARPDDFTPTVRNLRNLAEEALASVLRGAVNAESAYYPKVLAAVRDLAEDLASIPSEVAAENIDENLNRWRAILDGGGDWYTKAGRALRRGLYEALADLQVRRDEQRALPHRRNFLRLTELLSRALAEAKKKRGSINFDDILILARSLLARNPGLRRRQATRHRLVVVDEFQDTNRLQADLLAYLLIRSDDDRSFPEDYPIWREMNWSEASDDFVVFGDLKQSIYRFRGAEVDIMGQLNRRFQKGHGKVLALDRNYRSQAPLVDFFNRLFSRRLGSFFSELDLQLDQRPPLYPGPHVLNLTSPRELRPAQSQDRAEAQAGLLTRYLADLFSGRLGVRVPDQDGLPRLPQPGDVAVIFRAFTRAPIFKAALIEAGWNCSLAVSDNPFEYAEVKALLAACQFLWDIDRDLSLAAALRSPLGPVSDAALTLMAWPKDRRINLSDYFLTNLPWPEELNEEDINALESLKKIFSELRPLRGRLKPVEIMERLVEERNLLPMAVLEKDGDERVRAVTGFLGLSRRVGLSRRGRILGPVEELMEMRRTWDPRRDGGKSASAEEALTLMTVHAAKGLEFPIVVVAEADRTCRRPSPSVVISPVGQLALRFRDFDGRQVKPADFRTIFEEEQTMEARENARLLYVAATRARDQLVFLGWPAPPKKAKKETPVEDEAEEAWLETILNCPDAAELMEQLEYGPDREQAETEPMIPQIMADHVPATASPLLSPMRLESWTLPVTSLGRFLADSDGFLRSSLLGLDSALDWQPGQPFFTSLTAAPTCAGTDSFNGARPRFGYGSDKKLSPAEAGTLFHAALEKLDPLNPQIKLSLNTEALRLGFDVSQDEIEKLAQKVLAFLQNHLGQAWQAGLRAGRRSWRELPFTMRLSGISTCLRNLTLKGVIDLFFETEDGGQIVDYKLAQPQTGFGLDVYEHQLRIYAQALISAGFKKKLSASLYFAGGDEAVIHQVSLDQELPMGPVLEALEKKCEEPLNNRPLRPAYPGAQNIVYFSIT